MTIVLLNHNFFYEQKLVGGIVNNSQHWGIILYLPRCRGHQGSLISLGDERQVQRQLVVSRSPMTPSW